MYKIRTEFEFEAAHYLRLNYSSPCERLHGHSYKCAITLASDKLNENGMIVDFKELKRIIKVKVEDKLDHKNLNEIFEQNTTAENMSKWIYDEINDAFKETNIKCIKVELNETSKNKAIYEE